MVSHLARPSRCTAVPRHVHGGKGRALEARGEIINVIHFLLSVALVPLNRVFAKTPVPRPGQAPERPLWSWEEWRNEGTKSSSKSPVKWSQVCNQILSDIRQRTRRITIQTNIQYFNFPTSAVDDISESKTKWRVNPAARDKMEDSLKVDGYSACAKYLQSPRMQERLCNNRNQLITLPATQSGAASSTPIPDRRPPFSESQSHCHPNVYSRRRCFRLGTAKAATAFLVQRTQPVARLSLRILIYLPAAWPMSIIP